MTFDSLLRENLIQKQIDKLAKKYKNKKIVIYGTGMLSEAIFRNYDLSALNIVAIVNIKYGGTEADNFLGKTCIYLKELKDIDFDIALIANEDYLTYKYQLQNFLYKNNIKKKIKIRPLVKLKPECEKLIDRILGVFYIFMNPSELARTVINFWAAVGSFYIIDSRLREKKKRELKKLYSTKLYGYQVLRFAKSIGEKFLCLGFSKVTRNTILGNSVNFNGMEIVGKGKVTIGDYFHSGKGCLIISDNHNYDSGNAIPYDNKVIEKDIEIGDFVWFGARVTILPSTKIGEGVIVQAGSVVHGEIPDYAIIGGNPATIIKYRDIEHFKQLKAEKKFH